MSFPTIPTVAAGRILVTLDTAGGATKTFPSLSDLTKNNGDLLIAIAVTYDGNSTNAEFSSWGGSFTEFVDQATTATMGIGAAYKFSTGSETGTFTVTTADTSASDSALILISIPGAHASTPPEGGTITNGTAAAADIAALNPAGWAAEDTLWIAVGGSGEDGSGGAFTGVASAPTNYTDYFESGISADVVGGVEAALAFRQLNAASDDPASFSVDVSNARNSALLIAVRPAASTPATVTPEAIARSFTVPAPTVKGAAATTPAAIAQPVTVPAVTVKGAAKTLPAAISRSFTVPAVTAFDSGAPGSVSPTVLNRSFTVPSVTVKGGSVAAVSAVSRPFTLPSVTVKGGAVVGVGVVAGSFVVLQATASGGGTPGTVTPGVVTLTVVIPQAVANAWSGQHQEGLVVMSVQMSGSLNTGS